MKTIVITAPDFVRDEAEIIRVLLEEGADRVHVRKPGSSEADFRRLLDALPEEYMPQLTLQDHLELAQEYGAGGVHLSSRHSSPPEGFTQFPSDRHHSWDGRQSPPEGQRKMLLSRSCHTFDEVTASLPVMDYVFLSPIFDSISKAGYRAGFSDGALSRASEQGIINDRVIALGGILPEHLRQLENYGFGGAAFLGYIWKNATPAVAAARIKAIAASLESSAK